MAHLRIGPRRSCCRLWPVCSVAFPFCRLTLYAPKPLPRFYPQVVSTIGDHLRKRRLDLGQFQRQVAEQLGADHCSVTNWELNRTQPALWFLPAIVRFLGYVPWTADGSIGEPARVAPTGQTQGELA